jgi:RNA polymerase sigma-70 factor, ECF subfamily
MVRNQTMGEEPFEAIVASHHGEIHRYLRRLTSRAALADDLAQETFLRAYRAHRSLPAEANVRAWLFTIATNLVRNERRGERRRRMVHSAVLAAGTGVDGEGPEARARFNEARGALEAVIGRLPLKQRMAFTLRKLHDLSYDEIARSLGCSPESARAHVFQAFRKIRRALDRDRRPEEAPR